MDWTVPMIWFRDHNVHQAGVSIILQTSERSSWCTSIPPSGTPLRFEVNFNPALRNFMYRELERIFSSHPEFHEVVARNSQHEVFFTITVKKTQWRLHTTGTDYDVVGNLMEL